MKKWLVIFSLLFFMMPANALEQLHFKGFIADEANLLSEDVKNDLNMTLWDLQKKSGADIAVVTLPSLQGRRVSEVAIEIGRTYKIGSKEKNNGIVFLTAPIERKMRIELGTGLEKKISMDTLENIRDHDILPYYKALDYKNGIIRGTYRLVEVVAEAEGVTVNQQGVCPAQKFHYSDGKNRHYPWWIYPLAIILAIFSPRRRRFNSSSFGGFGGGGGFHGSGCSGSW